MDLTAMYDQLEWWERKALREKYVLHQCNKCFYCGEVLSETPPSSITSKKINRSLFPHKFLKYPIHLHHDHDTGLTEGAVHSYCNAVLWQYENK
jgi:hypothetical protein